VPKKVLILAGGGGHTGYAYALAQRLQEKASLSFLVPENDELSWKRLKRFGTVEALIKPRGPKTPLHKFVMRLQKALLASLKKVSRENNVIVSTGSNFCIPPALSGWIKGIPIINLESSVRFSKASLSVRLLKPVSKITVLQWEEQRKFINGVVVGPLLQRPEVKPWDGGYILVTGGTYGHKLLFDVLAESKLENIVLQTGKINPQPYIEKHPEWKILTLSEKFHELIAGAQVVVTHFGSTVLDAIVYRKPIVLVPNPEWTRTAGMEDAKYLAKKLNATLVSRITLENLMEAIGKAKKAKVPTLPDGAENLANLILKYFV
jgi:UDP-N-acetylglucosamine:LPS N-acetylglucosamine transferase